MSIAASPHVTASESGRSFCYDPSMHDQIGVLLFSVGESAGLTVQMAVGGEAESEAVLAAFGAAGIPYLADILAGEAVIAVAPAHAAAAQALIEQTLASLQAP